jgi:hypothetical protein
MLPVCQHTPAGTLPLAGRVGEGDQRALSWSYHRQILPNRHPLPTSPVEGEVPFRGLGDIGLKNAC